MTTETATQDEINSRARSKAQAALEGLAVKPVGLVEYRSQGRVAVIGGPSALEFAPRLQDRHKTHVVLLHGVEEPGASVLSVAGRRINISGYLGNFNITLGHEGKANYEQLNVDIILDLGTTPLIDTPLLPPGYIHADDNEYSLSAAEQQLNDLIGTFEKPRYFDYDASICAHGRAGHTACNRCVAACPAEAITSLAERIEVNPYLCQGGGICASACPTGAIRYTYPGTGDMLNRIRRLLQVYCDEGGQQPVVVFVAEADVTKLPTIASHVLPVVVEEVASVGLDTWLSTLAYGARRVLLVAGDSLVTRVQYALQMQLIIAWEILQGLGYEDDVIALLAADELNSWCTPLMPDIPPATFIGLNEKRRAIFMALDHLYQHSSSASALIPLSTGAPFGTIEVNQQACTLCMACTSVCPSHAVFAGNDEPQLLFNESQCVQCGLCETACPERAITLGPRLLAEPQLRQRKITLHEEAPLCCVSCGKPFATRSMVNNMLAKLEGHWMFQDERARRRLMMCDDCRVVDIVQDPNAMEEGFIDPRQH